jgi:hypothetical protein
VDVTCTQFSADPKPQDLDPPHILIGASSSRRMG